MKDLTENPDDSPARTDMTIAQLSAKADLILDELSLVIEQMANAFREGTDNNG